MSELIKDWAQYLAVIFVGSLATIVKMLNDESVKARSAWDKTMIFITGAVTSAFLCWLAYEAVYYYAQNQHLALAVGGFTAWKGGEWATRIIDRFINIKILGCDECDDK